jgi:hypothetical protein
MQSNGGNEATVVVTRASDPEHLEVQKSSRIHLVNDIAQTAISDLTVLEDSVSHVYKFGKG